MECANSRQSGECLRTFTGHIVDPHNGPVWTVQVSGHPPLITLLFVGLAKAGLPQAGWAAAVCVAVGATAVGTLAADPTDIPVAIEKNRFDPDEMRVKAGKDTPDSLLQAQRLYVPALQAEYNAITGYNQALMFAEKLHPIGPWYHVAQVFDGKMYRSYVNGELQGEAAVAFKAQGPGRTSVGPSKCESSVPAMPP